MGGKSDERLFQPDFFWALQACVPFSQNHLEQGKQPDQMNSISVTEYLYVEPGLYCPCQQLGRLLVLQDPCYLCKRFDDSWNCKADERDPSSSREPGDSPDQ